MNTNSNTYTVIYSTVLVIVVAAILAFVSTSLAPKQKENERVQTMTDILKAANLGEDADSQPDKAAYIKQLYSSRITSAIIVDCNGNKAGEMPTGIEDADFTVNLKSQYDIMKKIEASADGAQALRESLRLPVYICDSSMYILPCYGAGLWGPIWGYIAIRSDINTLEGANFAHKSETPGLGAEIATPKFAGQFSGRQIYQDGKLVGIAIVKGGADPESVNEVDAISGGTITSQALSKTIAMWLSYYEPFLNARKAASTPNQMEE